MTEVYIKVLNLYYGLQSKKQALADAEVEYLDHTSNTIFAAFKVKDTKKEFLKNVNIIIWTTTPWTIPANKALAYNSNIEYSLIEISLYNILKTKNNYCSKFN